MTTAVQKFSLEVPAMYADHHVIEVRRILSELPGVDDLYASSSFGVVEGCLDPAQTSLEAVQSVLQEAGYLGAVTTEVESSQAQNGKGSFMRHTALYDQTRSSVSFGQVVSYQGRPMWPCPGMGVIKGMEE